MKVWKTDFKCFDMTIFTGYLEVTEAVSWAVHNLNVKTISVAFSCLNVKCVIVVDYLFVAHFW